MDAIKVTDDQLRQMQATSWEMYEYFAAFCDEHDLLYYACGGCCIGAVRDGGFVPWDDDIDVFMPRPDYERLAQLWPQYADKRYEYVRTTERMVTGDLMAKICDSHTTLVTTYQVGKNMPQGLTMDILPLDGCPDSTFARRYQMACALIFSLFCAQSIPENHGGLMSFGSRLLLGMVPSRRVRYRIWKAAEKRMTQWSFDTHEQTTELCSGPRYMRNVYQRRWFAASTKLPFDDGAIAVPVGYDEYLTAVFGDYMTPPPESARKPSHEVAVIDLDTPYRESLGDRD